MSRILVIFPSTVRGGVEEYSIKITSALVKNGWEVHVAFPKAEATESVVRDLNVNDVIYHRLEIAEVDCRQLETLRKHLPHFIRTVLLLLKVNPHVVEIVLPYPPFCLGSILACSFLSIPTLIRFGLVPRQWSFSSKILKLYARARARNQQYLAISQNNRQLICSSFKMSESEVDVIYNGIRVKSNQINPEQGQALRSEICQQLGVSLAGKLLLTVARLASQKGYDDLIPVIPHIVKQFPDVRFVWAGEGPQRQELVAKLREYGIKDKVLLLGYRDDVPNLLEAADLFVFPTHYEGGQSWAVAEAMTHGLPIVASNASGIPEVIEHKVQGLLFRTGDSCELLETLRWALKHPDKMQEMAENAKLRVKDFSEEKMVKETLEVLEKLAKKTR